ncbi:hypothetical protein OG21DRAFT_1483095 [Imleria badia]|nr:hypothetical protein OG21DRAFT_1483095 [Imleria badia]
MEHGSSSSRQEEVGVDYQSITRKINGDPMVATLRSLYPGDLDKSCCDTLLSYIVMHSEGWLDQRYCSLSEAATLRAERKELEHQLLLAWKFDSFKDILDLDCLQITTQPSTLDHPLQSQSDNEDFQQAVEAAWNVPYVGKHHILLFNNINGAMGSDPYLNIGAMIQSSGTGKSRMMDEQAKLVFTLPINIWGTFGISTFWSFHD